MTTFAQELAKKQDNLVAQIVQSILGERQPLFSDSVQTIYAEDGDVGIKTFDGYHSSCVDVFSKVAPIPGGSGCQAEAVRQVREQLIMWLAQAEQAYVVWKKQHEVASMLQQQPARHPDALARIVSDMRLGEHNPRHGRPAKDATLKEDIRAALNRHSRENRSNTPDYVLAEYLMLALESFECGVRLRSRYRGEDTAKQAAVERSTQEDIGPPLTRQITKVPLDT